jgi:hypothetical protein
VTNHRLWRRGSRLRASHVAGGLLAAIVLSIASPALAVDDPWAPGTGWLSFRVGYSKLAADNAPNGAAGYGFGYNRMLGSWGPFRDFALGGYVHHEVRGRRGPSVALEVPFTLELTKQIMLQGQARPYIGLGYGAYVLKGYRIPDEYSSVRGGFYFVTGFNAVVSDHSLLGIDLRGGTVVDTEDQFRWGLKLNYSWAY